MIGKLLKHTIDVVTVLVLVAAGYLMLRPGSALRTIWEQHQADRASVKATGRLWSDVTAATSHMAGDSVAIRIIEVSDYGCPFCRQVNAVVDSTVDAGVGIGFLNLPSASHPNSEGAAIAALCAEEEGRFRSMHDRLMNSVEWQTDSNWTRDARAAGVQDLERFQNCLEGSRVRERLSLQRALADSLFATVTPTFLSRGEVARGVITKDALLKLAGMQ
jgi:protein-disulfide isomerase